MPSLFSGSSAVYLQPGVVEMEVEATSPSTFALFHDYRLEAWRSEGWEQGGALIRESAAPFATAPATAAEGSVRATLRFNTVPGVEYARLALTAIGPDGQRYLLDLFGPDQTEFHGSVWDWFAALVQQWTK